MNDKMPDEIYKAEKSCTLCHGHGLYVVGSSGSADDGDAPIYEGCDCAVKYMSVEKAKADKLELLDKVHDIWDELVNDMITSDKAEDMIIQLKQMVREKTND